MSVNVVDPDPSWPAQFEAVSRNLREILAGVPVISIEHVGSTSVPGLAAKPILDIDILVSHPDLAGATRALEEHGYRHLGDLGVIGREAFSAPDRTPQRNTYLSTPENVHVRNHLAVRDVLRSRTDLREEYAAVKRALAADESMDIDTYVAKKSDVLQRILRHSSLTDDELAAIRRLNNPSDIPTL